MIERNADANEATQVSDFQPDAGARLGSKVRGFIDGLLGGNSKTREKHDHRYAYIVTGKRTRAEYKKTSVNTDGNLFLDPEKGDRCVAAVNRAEDAFLDDKLEQALEDQEQNEGLERLREIEDLTVKVEKLLSKKWTIRISKEDLRALMHGQVELAKKDKDGKPTINADALSSIKRAVDAQIPGSSKENPTTWRIRRFLGR